MIAAVSEAIGADMDIGFRIGEAADTELIVDQILQAGDGLFESLLDGVVPGIRARQFLRMAVNGARSGLFDDGAVASAQRARGGDERVVGRGGPFRRAV